jgi:N-acetyl-gamma-glutamyl-phosphate reductase
MNSQNKIKIGILGGSGYAGEELVRLISLHPNADLVAVSSRDLHGKSLQSVYGQIHDLKKINFVNPDDSVFLECEVVFLATPHGFSMSVAGKFLDNGIKVIDLSADFRITNPESWKDWYESDHTAPDLLKQSVYGLTELNNERIKEAHLVAVPGCYPTASLLGLLPILESGLEIDSIIIDAKSGISGAGRAKVESSLSEEIVDDFVAYAVDGHRHLPEIKQGVELICKKEVHVSFVPHLIPTMRGIFASIYVQVSDLEEDLDLDVMFSSYYQDSLFVEILTGENLPSIKAVCRNNKCNIAIRRTSIPGQVLILVTIDNLLKGASGQAIECFNLMEGFDATTGLN